MASGSEWEAALRSDDRGAQEEALRDLRDFLTRTLARGFAHQLTESEREDLVQDSLLRITEKLDSFEGRSQFSTWSAAIAVNAALGRLRSKKHQSVSWETLQEDGEQSLSATASSSPEETERDEALKTAINTVLSERQKEILFAELSGVELMEIARRLGASRGAIYKTMHDARKKLRAYFDEHGLVAADLLSGEKS